jgi:hypothetical protein
LDTASDSEDFVPNASQPNDSTRPLLDYANSNFDVRNRFTWIFGCQFPNHKGSFPLLSNGWGLDSTVTLQDGQPFNLNYNFEDDFSGSGEGLPYKNWDLALYKNTHPVISSRLSLRAEYFNIVNRPNFSSPLLPNFIADVAHNGFAHSGSREVSQGNYAITATGDVGLGKPFLGGGAPRGIQLAAKFSF